MNKINYVIIGSNKDPLYLDFWPVVSKVWREKFNIIPVLGLIDEFESDIEESEFGLIKRFKFVENINSGFLSQIVRLFLPKFLDGICLVSDIDMIPISKKYFQTSLNYVTDENMVIFSSNHPQTIKNKMFPMCYIAADSKIYKKIFDLDLDWESFCKLLLNRGEDWYTDQKYLYEKAIDFQKKCGNLILLDRTWNQTIDNRIDRANWNYIPQLIKKDHYIDCHSLRPYNQFKNEINNLINLI